MKNFKKPSFGGGSKFGGDRGGDRRESFGNKRSFGGDRGSRGGFGGGDRGFAPKEMHPATCANCGKATEVPFRPSGERPVYCRDCFDAQKPEGDRDFAPRNDRPHFDRPQRSFDREPRREFTPRSDSRPDARSERPVADNSGDIAGIKKQLDTLTTKLDRILNALESQVRPATAAAQPAAKEPEVKAASKVVDSKPAAKAVVEKVAVSKTAKKIAAKKKVAPKKK